MSRKAINTRHAAEFCSRESGAERKHDEVNRTIELI
jgi:hypothetical protein